jgi:exodeoxyribonuclease VII large subunit
MNVTVYGRVSLYEKSGQYQIYAEVMMADGIGELAIAFERLKQKLDAEGLFSQDRKKPLPKMPRRVGIITSPTGAAVRDMINVSGRRYPLADVLLFPAAVQGVEAPSQLTMGIEYFNAMESVDVIIIGRGGGSIEDLWAFNDEGLVRAIAASRIPVISAVGHETDFTLCDFVADRRAPTPSAAAELAVPDISVIENYLVNAKRRIDKVADIKLSQSRETVSRLEKIISLNSPASKLDNSKMSLLHLATRLENAVSVKISDSASALGELSAKLSGMNPLSVLSRGYGMVESERGDVLSSVKQVNATQKVRVRMSDGSIGAVVTDISPKKEGKCKR